jgi:uncharacterized membrane protein YccC
VNARGAVLQSVTLALACLASYSLVRYASAHIQSLSHGDDQVAGLWAVIATAFVFRASEDESVTAAKTRVAATALSFALCFVYLLFLPSQTWGLPVLVGLSTFLLISLGQSGDVGVAAITIGAVMVISALGPHDPWKQPLIGAVATAVGIAVGVAASWLANGNLVDGPGDSQSRETVELRLRRPDQLVRARSTSGAVRASSLARFHNFRKRRSLFGALQASPKERGNAP